MIAGISRCLKTAVIAATLAGLSGNALASDLVAKCSKDPVCAEYAWQNAVSSNVMGLKFFDKISKLDLTEDQKAAVGKALVEAIKESAAQ
jgi:hypothetical protein